VPLRRELGERRYLVALLGEAGGKAVERDGARATARPEPIAIATNTLSSAPVLASANAFYAASSSSGRKTVKPDFKAAADSAVS
jgi:hypothetical protein